MTRWDAIKVLPERYVPEIFTTYVSLYKTREKIREVLFAELTEEELHLLKNVAPDGEFASILCLFHRDNGDSR